MKFLTALLVCCVLALSLTTPTEARIFGRNRQTTNQPTFQQPQAPQPTELSPVPADPQPTLGTTSPGPAGLGPQPGETRTAQGVANIQARLNRVGHFGGNPGYEGCGMAGTPQAAYNICCYANSGMRTVDVGYARGANGMWFCCRRYQ